MGEEVEEMVQGTAFISKAYKIDQRAKLQSHKISDSLKISFEVIENEEEDRLTLN